MPDRPDDPLDELRERIQATQDAAERLAREATGARAAYDAGDEPPEGWRTTADHEARTGELHALVSLLDSLRGLIPAELQAQLTEVVRQVLLLVRALIDWLVDRLDVGGSGSGPGRAAGAGPDVQDIPIS
jgi:hypothetical protein